MVALALPGFLRAAPVLRAIVAALLARSAIHAAGKLKKFSAPALAVRRDEVHELMELLPPPDAKALGGEALSEIDYARFLSVCRWKVDRAANMLRADLEWRRGARPRLRGSCGPRSSWSSSPTRSRTTTRPRTASRASRRGRGTTSN